MFEHYFQAVGDCGHVRNFTWNRGIKKELKYVHSYCPICSMDNDEYTVVRFNVKKYLELVKELK